MAGPLSYPDIVLPRLRYQFCPMCSAILTQEADPADRILRVKCSQCPWTHYPSNTMGVNVIVRLGEQIVVILSPDEPEEAPAALPGGHVEYGESPEEAAIREAYEETGMVVEIVRCLDWYFNRGVTYPGPMVSFIFETRAIGGILQGRSEGKAVAYSLETLPPISPNRSGSQRALQVFLKSIIAVKLE